MEVRYYSSLLEIPATAWRKLNEDSSFPFHDYDYLKALETSGSVGPNTGWQPIYLTIWRGELLEAASLVYLRTDSYGEYIFDWAWANAFHQLGEAYYPKLTTAIPFTPATGTKFLLHPLIRSEAIVYQRALLAASLALMQKTHSSSYHALFIPEVEQTVFTDEGLFIRHSFQYHWENHGYKNFDDFLARLKRKRRNEIKRERASIKQLSHLQIRRFEGADLTTTVAQQMYEFYLATIEKNSAIPYLRAEFFSEVFRTMRDKIVVFFAYDERHPGRPIAGTLNFYKGDKLFGRYWGCREEIRHLHFELCYYQTIEFAIDKGLKFFEAGAQGEHKFGRGFVPQLTYSAHLIRHKVLSHAIEDFVGREKLELTHLFKEYDAHWPYSLPKS